MRELGTTVQQDLVKIWSDGFGSNLVRTTLIPSNAARSAHRAPEKPSSSMPGAETRSLAGLG
jgi:hypothetical protein